MLKGAKNRESAAQGSGVSRSNFVSMRYGLRKRTCGFTMLELMIVLSVMMIIMAYRGAVAISADHVVQAREAVLRSNIDLLDKVIEQYRMDKRESPQSFDDLVSAGYFSSTAHRSHDRKDRLGSRAGRFHGCNRSPTNGHFACTLRLDGNGGARSWGSTTVPAPVNRRPCDRIESGHSPREIVE